MPGSHQARLANKEIGVPVVEGIGAPIRMAAMLAGLGLKHSRERWPKSIKAPGLKARGGASVRHAARMPRLMSTMLGRQF